jgi:hypothetical protein
MKIPKSWAEVTVSQFQEISRLDRNDELDYLINSISVLCHMDIPDVENLTITELRDISSQMTFLNELPTKFVNEFKIDGKTYQVDPLIHHITAGQYIDLNKYIQDGVEENLHKILTCFCFPTYKRLMRRKRLKYGVGYDLNELADKFQGVSIDVVYPICVFFCKLTSGLMPLIQDSLINKVEKMNKQAREILEKHSNINGDGLQLSTH